MPAKLKQQKSEIILRTYVYTCIYMYVKIAKVDKTHPSLFIYI